MKKTKKIPISPLAKAASRIKVNKKLDKPEKFSPFLKKKMEEASRIIAMAELPK
jgi:hypothetical protein